MSLSALLLLLASIITGPNDPNEPAARRDHGPGTSAGGVNVASAELLREGGFEFSFRVDYTGFERLSPSDIESRTRDVSADHAHFDALRWSMLQTFELAYGASDDVQLGLMFGYYRGNDAREGHIHGNGSYGFHEFGDVSGPTDMWINTKVQVARGPSGRWAVFGGVKLPTGRDDVTGEGETEPLEPSMQPGSGTFDFLLGGAYSTWLSERIAFDAAVSYVLRTEEDDFKIGDRADAGVAVSYRLAETMNDFPRVSLFVELTVRHFRRNEEAGEEVENSGGTTLFFAPGVRVAFSDRVTLSLAPQIPLVQALNDEQQETDFKVMFSLTVSP